MGKNNFRKKNWLDIKFSVIALFGVIALYVLLSIIIDVIRNGEFRLNDGSFLMLTVPLGMVLVPSLLVNIIVQIVLNDYSAKNNIKSYLFFVALNMDIIVLNVMFDGIYFKDIFVLFISLVFVDRV